jgi:hypothetical protein
VSTAQAILARLNAVGARVECRGDRLVIRAGRRPVPMALIAEAREAKAELSKALKFEDAQQQEDEHLRAAEARKSRISAALFEDAHDEHLRAGVSAPAPKMLIEDAHVSTFDKAQDFSGFPPDPAPKMLISSSLSTFGPDERLRTHWGRSKAARAAINEDSGRIPRAWTEGFATLDPSQSLGDVPPVRWRRFVDDVRRFLGGPFCAIAAALGWGPYDLFGCDRDRPFARIDQAGLLWLLNGDRLLVLVQDTATIETRTGARYTWRRSRREPGRVLAWELTP